MQKISKSSIILIIAAIIFSTSIYAIPQSLYDGIREKILRIAEEFTKKDSQLTETGDLAQEKLNEAITKTENEIRENIAIYEQEQIALSKEIIINNVNQIISQLEAEKDDIERQIKEKVKEKIDKDLEKELKKLENVLKN